MQKIVMHVLGRSLLAGVLVTAAACGHDAQPAGGTPDALTWAAPVAVTGALGGAAPVFAASPGGSLTLAWVSAPGNGSDGELSIRPDAWVQATHELRDPLGGLAINGEVPPKIAYGPDGALYATYLVARATAGKKRPEMAIRFARSTDGGARWTTPVTVTATATGDSVFGSYDDHALYAAPDGAIYVSWLAASGKMSNTYFVRSTDRGATWSRPAVVDPGGSCPCCRTAMTSGPDGALYVAWRKIYPGDSGASEVRDIVVARSDDRGRTWHSPIRVHADDWHVTYCPNAGPSIRVGEDGTVHVAWWTGKEGHAGVQYAQSTDRAATFSAPVALDIARFSRPSHVQLALGSGAARGVVLAAWDDGTLETPRIVARVSRDGGRTFGAAQALSDTGAVAGYPIVGLRGDTALVAWQQRSAAGVASDSVAHAHMDMSQPASHLHTIGALQVVARSGILPAPSRAP